MSGEQYDLLNGTKIKSETTRSLSIQGFLISNHSLISPTPSDLVPIFFSDLFSSKNYSEFLFLFFNIFNA